MPGPFVGRGPELAALAAVTTRLGPRTGPTAGLVIGAPGTGKSRLLEEFLARGGIAEAVALRGYELERSIPLATAGGLLQRLAPLSEAEALPAEGTTPTPLDRVRLFERVHLASAALGPVLIVVDDAHWADDTTIALLHYLVRAAVAGRQPLALVAAGRPGVRSRVLGRSLQDLLPPNRFAEISLGPLSEADGVHLVRQIAPRFDATAASELWRRAGGSPFWLRLLVSDEGAPADVDRVVAERVETVGPDAEAVAALLAVVARPLMEEEISAVCGWPEDRTSDAVAALELVGLAARGPAGALLSHDLVREAVTRALSRVRARQLHRRFGRWLEREAGDDDTRLLEALEHRRAGGDAVSALALRLVRSPRRRLLGVTGLRRLLAVAEDAESAAGDDDALLRALGRLAAELGEHEMAYRIWSDRSTVVQPPEEEVRALLQTSEAATALARGHDARAALERARSLADDNPALLAEVLAQESSIQHYLDGDLAAARTTAWRALAAVRPAVAAARSSVRGLDLATRRAWLRAALVASEAALTSDDPEQMLVIADELAAAAAGLDPRAEVQARIRGAMALRFLGRNADAEQRLREALHLCRQQVLPESTIQVGTTLARVLVSLGRLQEAHDVLADCRQLGARVGTVTPVRAFGVVLESLLELTMGSWTDALTGLEDAATHEQDPHFRLQAHLERAAAWSRIDAWSGIGAAPGEVALRQCVAAALADAESAGCLRCRTETLLRCAQVLARTGAVDDARELMGQVEVNPTDAYNGLWSRWAEAWVLAAAGDSTAPDALDEVVAYAERQQLFLEALWARLDLALVLMPVARDRAADVLVRSCAEAEGMGASTELRVAARLLRSLGVRAWRRGGKVSGADALAALTAREREIARQVATGASNPEIAAAMFISRKTVEHHVSHILAKLDVRNRAELVALMADGAGKAAGVLGH